MSYKTIYLFVFFILISLTVNAQENQYSLFFNGNTNVKHSEYLTGYSHSVSFWAKAII